MAERSDISALLEHVGVEGMTYYEFELAPPLAGDPPPGRVAPPAAPEPVESPSPESAPTPESTAPAAPMISIVAPRRQQGAFDLRDYGARATRAEMRPPRLKLTIPAGAPTLARTSAERTAPAESEAPKPVVVPSPGPEKGPLGVKPVAETPPEKESLQDLFARL